MALQLWVETAVGILIKIYEGEEERQEARQLLSDFSDLIRRENRRLLRQLAAIVREIISDAKLEACQNKSASIARLFREYANAPDAEQRKLDQIDFASAECLDILDDDDIRLGGLHTYAAVANLRVATLAFKASHADGANQNGLKQSAVQMAQEAIAHITSYQEPLIEQTKARVSGPANAGTFGWSFPTGGYMPCQARPYVRIDGGSKIWGDWQTAPGLREEECTTRLRPLLQAEGQRILEREKNKLVNSEDFIEIRASIDRQLAELNNFLAFPGNREFIE